MRSRARFRKHPLHPMLIAFPIAFGAGCLAADLVERLGGWRISERRGGAEVINYHHMGMSADQARPVLPG